MLVMAPGEVSSERASLQRGRGKQRGAERVANITGVRSGCGAGSGEGGQGEVHHGSSDHPLESSDESFGRAFVRELIEVLAERLQICP